MLRGLSKQLSGLQEQVKALEHKCASLDTYTYEKLLQTCGSLGALEEGKRVHEHIARWGFGEHRLFLENHLLNMYAKCGSLDNTQKLFSSIRYPNVVSWNAVIGGYAQSGHPREALGVYQRMQLEGTKPSRVTFTNILSACSCPEDITLVHSCILEVQPGNVLLENSLVNTYGKFRELQSAKSVFEGMQERTVVSWNSMIAAYAECGRLREAFHTFKRMELEGVHPCIITFLGLLSACSSLTDIRFVHARITESGLESEVLLGTCLITTYGKCGSLECARRVFEITDRTNIVTWNAMFSAYAQSEAPEALHLLEHMLLEGLRPVNVTLIGALNASSSPENTTLLQRLASETGLDSNSEVSLALSNRYTRAGKVAQAQVALRRSKHSNLDVVSWTSIMTSCMQNGQEREALYYFRMMQSQGVPPNNFTVAVALEACAKLFDSDTGRRIHRIALDNGVLLDEFIATGLVNLYGRCGKLSEAQHVFDELGWSTLVLSTALIAAYSQNGFGKKALNLYSKMQLHGEQPNEVTFVTILSACSHAGLLKEGTTYFKSMTADHGITASPQHYRCMVDLFGRLGHLSDAEEIINRMPFQPGTVDWLTLLGANRNHGGLKQGEHAIEQVLSLNLNSKRWILSK